MVLCTGCFTDFPRGSYARHIALTLNPACRTAASAHRPTGVDDPVDDDLPPPHDPGANLGDTGAAMNVDNDEDDNDPDMDYRPPEPIHDFFGTNYMAAELGLELEEGRNEDDPINKAQSLSDSDSDKSDDEFSPDEADEPGWEAPAGEGPNIDDGSEEDGEEEVEVEDERIEGDEHDLRTRVEAALRQQIYVEHFPSEFAGQPVPEQARLPSGYGDYQTRLPHIGDPNNKYSPFTNKLDWCVGRWAKVRGPGSTAVSELLEIPGVRSLILSYVI